MHSIFKGAADLFDIAQTAVWHAESRQFSTNECLSKSAVDFVGIAQASLWLLSAGSFRESDGPVGGDAHHVSTLILRLSFHTLVCIKVCIILLWAFPGCASSPSRPARSSSSATSTARIDSCWHLRAPVSIDVADSADLLPDTEPRTC